MVFSVVCHSDCFRDCSAAAFDGGEDVHFDTIYVIMIFMVVSVMA